jgi:prolycopene isomerase
MKKYDAVVVGAGLSGLMSALSLIKAKKKVLLLDGHNKIGGNVRVSKKGRFEFNNDFFNFYLDKNGEEEYRLSNILEQIGLEDSTKYVELNNYFRVISDKKDYTMPLGKDNFIAKMEEYVPDSKESMAVFFELATECREALKYINTEDIDIEVIKEKYSNFMKVGFNSTSKVLDAIDMPVEAQSILNSCWLLLGSPETDVSFLDYGVFMANAIEYGLKVPKYSNNSIAMMLLDKYLELGGELKLNCEVKRIVIEEGKVNGVKLFDGSIVYANKVIVNSSINNVYRNLIAPNKLPRKALRSINKRLLGGNLFTVNLGLNRDFEDLGIKEYMTFLYHSLYSDDEYVRMSEISNGNMFAICPNVIDNKASEDGTCILTLNAVFFNNAFDKFTSKDTYFKDINDLAVRLINYYQKKTNITIFDFIEEIEIVTPIDIMAISNIDELSIYGYKIEEFESMLPKMLNKKKEQFIEGLEICNGFNGDLYNYSYSLYNGFEVANKK